MGAGEGLEATIGRGQGHTGDSGLRWEDYMTMPLYPPPSQPGGGVRQISGEGSKISSLTPTWRLFEGDGLKNLFCGLA